MSESIPEGSHPLETPSQGEMFEHLFPGNSFKDLPRFHIGNIDLFMRNNFFGMSEEGSKLSMDIVGALISNQMFVSREDISHPDKLTVGNYTDGTLPLGKTTHPTMFQGNSFSDLIKVDKGEKLAGIVARPISWYWRTLKKYGMDVNNFRNKPELILGVLDKDGKPRAIIHFVEGSGKRLPKEVKESSLQLKPSPLSVDKAI